MRILPSFRLRSGLIILWLAARAAFAVEALAADPQLRVAIIDVGKDAEPPAGFLDLLLVALSSEETIALLEREDLADLLKEQELDASLGRSAVSPDAIRLGALVGADVLLMISTDKPVGSSTPICIRIVETRQGVRFADLIADYPTTGSDVTGWFALPKTRILQQLVRVGQSRDSIHLIAVGDFFNRDLTRQSDWLGIALRESVARRLSSLPGFAVLERSEVRPLIDERRLAANLPDSLRKAAIIINGEYSLTTGADRTEVKLHVRFVRQDGQTVVERTVAGHLDDIEQLQQTISSGLMQLFGKQVNARTADAVDESQMLLDEGKRYLNVMQPVSARRPLLAAYALAPGNVEIQLCLMQCAADGFEGQWPPGRLQGDELTAYRRQIVPWYFFLANVGERLLNHEQLFATALLSEDQGRRRSTALSGYDFLFRSLREISIRCARDEFALKQVELLKPAIRALFNRYLSHVSELNDTARYEGALYTGITHGQWWAESPQQALEDRLRFLQQAADVKNPDSFGQWSLIDGDQYNSLGAVPQWSKRFDLDGLYEQFLKQLSASDQPLLRVGAELRWAHYFLRERNDEQRALPHFDRFIDLIVTEVLPNYPQMDSYVWQWVTTNAYIHKQGGSALTDSQAGNYYARVIRAACERAIPRYPQPWSLAIREAVARLQKAGEHEAAYHLLRGCRIALQTHSTSSQRDEVLPLLAGWQQEIALNHPHVVSSKIDADTILEKPRLISTQVVLDTGDARGQLAAAGMDVTQLRFRRLVESEGGLTLLCSAGDLFAPVPGEKPGVRALQYAVVRLEPHSFAVRSVSVTPEPLPAQQAPMLSAQVDRPGELSIAVDEENTFVGLGSYGLIWFRPGGPPVDFSPRHLAAPTSDHVPLPVDSVGDIAIVAQKLYGLAGRNPEVALFELDYAARSSRVLYSPRTAAAEHPLRHLHITSLANGPNGTVLLAGRTEKWTRDTGRRSVPAPHGFFSYRPRTEEYRHLQVGDELNPTARLKFQRGSHTGLFTGHHSPSLGILDPHKRSIKWLLASDPGPSGLGKVVWQSPIRFSQVASHGGELLLLGGLPGRRPQWHLFSPDRKEPQPLNGKNMPEPKSLSDLLVTSPGQVLAVFPERIVLMNVFSKN